MTRPAHKLLLCRWRTLRVLAALAWLAMVAMPAMMPAHAAEMSAPPADTSSTMQHGTPELMAGCCEGAAGQHADSHGCHCAVTCGACVVLPVTGLIAELWPALPEWQATPPALAMQSSSPPYRPPRV